ncbi:P123 [Spiroplasma kunkelii CR2-3x]|uniref:p123 n=1 Tax=Spiroplasma kunkelii CR2-3x TaxID=273035 RepID=A0A0K2JG19_SPIKU|nr:hypothetical protein [Spiroplasma kunkelii]ALA97357.1 P123 [Spiroplasma kunkelii CR2-3x]
MKEFNQISAPCSISFILLTLEVKLNGLIHKSQIKDDVKPILVQEFKNKLGIIPFWEMINEPNLLFLSTSTTLNSWPTMANCYKLQFDLEDSFNIKSKERYANRTHWYGQLDDNLMTAYNNGNKKVLQDVFSDIFIQSDQTAADGTSSQYLQVVLGAMNELRRQAHDTLIDIRENIRDNRHWMVFPFNVYSSYIPDTETGWKPNNAKPSDYGTYTRIFDNMESTIAQWQGSLKIVQKYKGKEINILMIDDFKKQPINSTIWANNETPFAIKLKDENENIYWKLIDGENIYDINRMLEYLKQYKLSYFINNDNKADNFYTKEVKVGKYWDAYMVDDRSSIQFGEAKFEQVFTQQSTERQYTLLILDEDAQKLNINDYYNFYTVFNDRGLNIGGGDINSAPQDRQWLYLSNVINYYSPYDGSFLWQEITFSSINDKISHSGLSVRQFI